MKVPIEKVVQLAAAGMTETTIAQACGCSVSYISQLFAIDEFRQRVADKKTGITLERIKADNKLEGIRNSLVDKMAEMVPYITKMPDALRAFEVIDRAVNNTQKGAPPPAPSNVVVLSLPNVRNVKFQLNANKELIDIDGRSTEKASANVIMEAAGVFGQAGQGLKVLSADRGADGQVSTPFPNQSSNQSQLPPPNLTREELAAIHKELENENVEPIKEPSRPARATERKVANGAPTTILGSLSQAEGPVQISDY
jgi:hypothetical protein